MCSTPVTVPPRHRWLCPHSPEPGLTVSPLFSSFAWHTHYVLRTTARRRRHRQQQHTHIVMRSSTPIRFSDSFSAVASLHVYFNFPARRRRCPYVQVNCWRYPSIYSFQISNAIDVAERCINISRTQKSDRIRG